MKIAYLIRIPGDDRQTLGAMITRDMDQVFVARTLELANKNNQPDISCIPIGQYVCSWTYSPHLDMETYEVKNVPGRAGIRIHSANYFFELKGCIALGDAHKDLNLDTEMDVVHSGDTVAHFNEIMAQEDFVLIVQGG